MPVHPPGGPPARTAGGPGLLSAFADHGVYLVKEAETDPDEGLIALLRSPEASMRARALSVLLAHPSGNPRDLLHIEALLTDCEPTVLSIPFVFGEVRSLAADVLVQERALQSVSEPVRIAGVPEELSANDLAKLAQEAGIQHGPGREGAIEAYRKLRDAGKIPTRDIDVDLAYLIEWQNR